MAYSARDLFRSAGLCMTLAALSLAGRPAPARADDPPEEAETVFEKLKPSTVSISNAEGSGTGILVDDAGLILTCAHVVTSPMAYQVKLDVGTADEPKDVVYKHVTIVGFHPERDLALIRIDPGEIKDHPPKLVAAVVSHDKAHSGQRIYAVGDPGAGDKVLTKTITQGIVSGVDREFDDQKFYQIDAAVNPGNSGGPVVDHAGRVLGIVTFQFNDLQALNFAIPLRDIDFTKFVPLTEHKANPQKAGLLLRYAKQFAAQADKAAREQGPDSDERKQYSSYAAYCYSEALVYDPSNPDIYDDIGTEYVTMDRDDAAVAYLTRAVELRPWDPPTANPYRQLGRAFRDQKQDEKAAAAWAEGTAKFPYAPGIWDDLAHFEMDREAYDKAAYAASVALADGPRPARVASLQKLLRAARGKLDDAGQSALNKRVAHDALVADLDELRQKSNRARKRKSLYVTTAFVELMKSIGSLDIPGVEDRIPQTPQHAPAKLATGDDASAAADDDEDHAPAAKPRPAADAEDPRPGHKRRFHPDQDPGEDKPIIPAADPGDDAPSDKGKKPHAHAAATDDDPDNVPDAPADAADHGNKPRTEVATAGGNGDDDWLGKGKKAGGAAPTTVPAAAGGGEPTEVPPTLILPRPAVTGLDLAGEAQTVDDARVVPLDVDNLEVADAVLSVDGSTAYVVQKDGMLRKLSLPSLKEERQLDLGSAVSGLGLTRDGLAVAVDAVHEIWVLDPGTLEVKHRVPLAGVVRLATSPGRSTFLASGGPADLVLVDPAAGRVVARYAADALAVAAKVAAVRFDLFAVSPDGKHVYLNGDGRICRFALTGSTLSFESAGPKLGDAPAALMVSPDGKYVAMPCRDGNAPPAGQPKADFATYVFRAADLATAVMTVQTGPAPGAMAFDAAARQIYAQSAKRQLIVFAPTGERVKDYVLLPNTTTQKFLVAPGGRHLLVLASGKVAWVTLP